MTSLDRLVPANHFYRHLEAKLDLGFIRALVRDCYAAGGRPSIDPVVFFKLQLIMFFEGIRSERKLIESASLHLAQRWYLGYHLDEPLPDHSSLTRIRERLGLPVFRQFFEHMVAQCQDAGLVWGKELFFDATKVRANAAMDSLVPRLGEVVDEHIVALFPGSTVAPATDATDATSSTDGILPAEGLQAVAASVPASGAPATCLEPPQKPQDISDGLSAPRRWDLLDTCQRDPEQAPAEGYRRLSDQLVSRTDPDACSMSSGGKASLGYHDHYVVDGGKHRIILAALVTPADVMENQPMLDLLWRVRFRWKVRPKRAVGDTTYGTIENIRTLEDAGIRAYVPLPNFDARTPYYGASRFHYDPEQDAYRCPQGQPLQRWKTVHTEEEVRYRAAAATCNACAVKAACTASNHGRQITRSFYADYLDRVRAYHETAAYQKAMRKRSVWVEPLFGEAKQWHGLRQFRLRGLARVNIEGIFVAAGQNLKRWLTATGWGRRHGPCGALAAPAPFPLAVLGFGFDGG
ncbi:MAG TPA: IS1182 family transposase [Chloroflexota bacterium]|nr:IS1182 family transposase [Chloroflexota bacterium]